MLFHDNTSGRTFRATAIVAAKAIVAAASIVAATLAATLFLAGCSQEPMFADIEKEVKLVDPSVRGTVASLVSLDGNLYATNGKVYVRSGGSGDWNPIALPAGAFRCGELASDGTWLYGRFTDSKYTGFHSVQRYNPATGGWDNTTGLEGCILIGSGDGRVYAFTGEYAKASLQVTTAPGGLAFGAAIANDLNGPDVRTTCGNYVATMTGVFSCDGTKLTDIAAGSEITGVRAITLGPNGNLYAVDAGYVWRFDGSAWTRTGHSLGKPTSISWLGSGKNILLVSNGLKGDATGGYVEMALGDDGSLATSTSRPGETERSSVSPTSHEQFESSIGEKALYGVFAVSGGAAASGNDYVVYASVNDTAYDGLWAYYPGTRREWNRE